MKTVKTSVREKRLRDRVVAAVLKHGLDRRKVYCVGMQGELACLEFLTVNCSGCSSDDPWRGDTNNDGAGSGCHWCGYTGKRKDAFPDPVKVGDGYLQIIPFKCTRCGKRQKHFDSGCATCAFETWTAGGNILNNSVPKI